MTTGALAMVRCLELEGVKTAFGYPGAAICPFYDALAGSPIHHVLVRTEQNAAHAASGYARISGEVGVCIATSGPGATNLLTGIASAYMDSIPLVVITGQVRSDLLGRDVFQEADITGAAEPFTKHSYIVSRASDIPRIFKEAFHIASTGRPGPVLIDVPIDMQQKSIPDFDYSRPVDIIGYKPRVQGHSLQIKKAVDALRTCKRPVICVGGGVFSAGAQKELCAFIEKLNLPAISTMMGIGALPAGHPLYFGMLGQSGGCAANEAVAESDLLIILGARADNRAMAKPDQIEAATAVVHIDIDAAEINKNIDTTCSVVSDAKTFLEKVLPYVKENKHTAWLTQIAEWRQKLDYRAKDDESVIHPHQLLRTVAEETPEDTIIATDVGQHQLWSAQYNGRRHPRQFLTSGGLGTMGFGYGAAVGAQIAFPGRTVVHITGDGSFHMNLNEICTAVSYKLPIITIIMNNRVLGNVRQWQTMFYGSRYSQTDPHRKTDYVKLADAFGAVGYRATNIAELREALRKAQQSEGPVLIDCQIDKDERVLPMIPAGGTIDDLVTD